MLPKKFEDKMKQMLAQEYELYKETLERPVNQGLRINTSKVSMEKWNEINPFKTTREVPWCREGYYYENEKVTKHPYYLAGLYYVQEPSAMSPAAYLPIEEDDYVLDLCAAPGGKSTQIGAKLGSEGILVSNDISASRAKALVKNIDNFGIKQAMVVSENPEKLAAAWPSYFDKILIDAPCSGEGMFKKDSNAIKNWGQDFTLVQEDILTSASKMLRAGGMMMYSTCTFSPEENEHIIRKFLDQNPEFETIEMQPVGGIRVAENNALRLWPHLLDGEGHFLCLMHKKIGNNVDTPKKARLLSTIADYEVVAKFVQENTHIPLSEPVIEQDGRVYLVSKYMPMSNKIRVLRSGLLLGEIKKNRFEPSHALSIAYPRHIYKNTIDLSANDSNVVKYLKGETLLIEKPKGYHVICVDNFPLGWVKSQNSMLKNQYPPSWRMN